MNCNALEPLRATYCASEDACRHFDADMAPHACLHAYIHAHFTHALAVIHMVMPGSSSTWQAEGHNQLHIALGYAPRQLVVKMAVHTHMGLAGWPDR